MTPITVIPTIFIRAEVAESFGKDLNKNIFEYNSHLH